MNGLTKDMADLLMNDMADLSMRMEKLKAERDTLRSTLHRIKAITVESLETPDLIAGTDHRADSLTIGREWAHRALQRVRQEIEHE